MLHSDIIHNPPYKMYMLRKTDSHSSSVINSMILFILKYILIIFSIGSTVKIYSKFIKHSTHHIKQSNEYSIMKSYMYKAQWIELLKSYSFILCLYLFKRKDTRKQLVHTYVYGKSMHWTIIWNMLQIFF